MIYVLYEIPGFDYFWKSHDCNLHCLVYSIVLKYAFIFYSDMHCWILHNDNFHIMISPLDVLMSLYIC